MCCFAARPLVWCGQSARNDQRFQGALSCGLHLLSCSCTQHTEVRTRNTVVTIEVTERPREPELLVDSTVAAELESNEPIAVDTQRQLGRLDALLM